MPIQKEERIIIIYLSISPENQNLDILNDMPVINEFRNFEINPGNSVILFLHIPNSLVFKGIRLMIAWSFIIKTSVIVEIEKPMKSYFTNDMHEIIYIGVKGINIEQEPKIRINSIIIKKDMPEKIYLMIELMYPNALYYEIGGNNNREGWLSLHLEEIE